MELDSHVHTWHSGQTSIGPLSLFMREAYHTPEGVAIKTLHLTDAHHPTSGSAFQESEVTK